MNQVEMKPLSSFKVFSLGVLAAGICLLLAPAGASALATGGIGGRPANPDPNNPRSESIFIISAEKGEVKRDAVLVSNNSNARQTIELYAVDGIVTNTGAYTCSQESEARQGVGKWVTLEKSSVVLDAGKTQQVGLELAMPESADVGEHNGCIVFQLADENPTDSQGVRIKTRQAIRLVATVPGDIYRTVDISNFAVGSDNGQQTFRLGLKNQGNVSADIKVSVILNSLFSQEVYRNGGNYPVLAEEKLDLQFTNDSPPILGGWYYAKAVIDYDSRAGVFGTESTQNLISKDSGRQLIFIAPSPLGALLLFILLAAIGGVIAWPWLKRRRRQRMMVDWSEYKIKSGDNIQLIAKRHNISWVKLASANSLSPPYILEPNQIIRVPGVANQDAVRRVTKRKSK